MEKLSVYAIPGIKKELMPKLYKEVTCDMIIEAVCEHFEFYENQIFNKRRFRGIVYARDIAIYFIKENTNLTLKEIVNCFKGAIGDHSTVLHALQKMSYMKTLPETKLDIDKINEILSPRINSSIFINN